MVNSLPDTLLSVSLIIFSTFSKILFCERVMFSIALGAMIAPPV